MVSTSRETRKGSIEFLGPTCNKRMVRRSIDSRSFTVWPSFFRALGTITAPFCNNKDPSCLVCSYTFVHRERIKERITAVTCRVFVISRLLLLPSRFRPRGKASGSDSGGSFLPHQSLSFDAQLPSPCVQSYRYVTPSIGSVYIALCRLLVCNEDDVPAAVRMSRAKRTSIILTSPSTFLPALSTPFTLYRLNLSLQPLAAYRPSSASILLLPFLAIHSI